MENVYVIGVGMTPFGRLAELSVKDLTRMSVQAALDDSGCNASDLQAAFFANAVQGHMEGQHMIRGQIALREMGIQSIPIVNVENACASASSAFYLAVNSLRAGASDVALAVGAEKMYSDDRERMFGAFDSGWDVYNAQAIRARLVQLGEGVEVPPGTTSPKPYSVFMDVYAAIAATTCNTSAPRSGRSLRWPPRTTCIRLKTLCRSFAVHSPSTRCSPRRRSAIR